MWKSDQSTSLKNDMERKPLNVQDFHDDCESLIHFCVADVYGIRQECPKICKVFSKDYIYYSMLEKMNAKDVNASLQRNLKNVDDPVIREF